MIVILLATTGIGAWTSNAVSVTEVDSCTTIDVPGTYVLTEDIRGGSLTNPCLVITASDVTLRGEGHVVSRLATRGNSLKNVSVVNVQKTELTFTNVIDGQIAGVDGRVRVSQSQRVDVSDSQLASADIYYSENVTIADNTLVNGSVELTSTENSTVERNRPAVGAYATYEVEYLGNNTVVDNLARSDGAYDDQGTFHFGSRESLIVNNTVLTPNGAQFDVYTPIGFSFSGPGSNLMVNNTVNLQGEEEVAYLASRSVNTVVSLTLSDGTNVTFTGNNIVVSATAETPEPPTGYGALRYYVEAWSRTSSGYGSWFTPIVSYDEAAVSEINESTLRFWQYGDEGYAPIGKLESSSETVDPETPADGVWRSIEGINNVGGVNDVDPERNIVSANITNLGAENRLVFRNQTTNGTNVTIGAVSLPRPGFVVVTDEREEIRGVSAYLSAGIHDDIVVQFAEPLENDTTLTAVAQSDANGDRRYGASAIRRACTFSGPNGTTLQTTAQVNIVRPDLEPAITSIERPTESAFSVSATVPAGGFIVVTGPDPSGDAGEFPTAGKSEYLKPGNHENVTVKLADYLEGMARNTSNGTVEVDVWLIRDNGDQYLAWSYNFPGTD